MEYVIYFKEMLCEISTYLSSMYHFIYSNIVFLNNSTLQTIPNSFLSRQ